MIIYDVKYSEYGSNDNMVADNDEFTDDDVDTNAGTF